MHRRSALCRLRHGVRGSLGNGEFSLNLLGHDRDRCLDLGVRQRWLVLPAREDHAVLFLSTLVDVPHVAHDRIVFARPPLHGIVVSLVDLKEGSPIDTFVVKPAKEWPDGKKLLADVLLHNLDVRAQHFWHWRLRS